MYHEVGIKPASRVGGSKFSFLESKTPAFDDRHVRQILDSIGSGDVVAIRDKTTPMIIIYHFV